MATVDELKSALKETLDSRGVLNRVRAQIRSEVFGALNNEDQQPPTPCPENVLINELIREYLAFNEYNFTHSTFVSEVGHTGHPLDRSVLESEVGVATSPTGGPQMPLLYSLVSHRGANGRSQPRAMATASARLAGHGAGDSAAGTPAATRKPDVETARATGQVAAGVEKNVHGVLAGPHVGISIARPGDGPGSWQGTSY